MNYLEKVKEFQETFRAPVLDKPTLIDKERAKLRIDLIQEELDELKEAYENDDLVEIGDALADLQYVLSGCVLEMGFQKIFDEMFAEVHRSNLSKACVSFDEADKTIQKYREEKGVDCFPIANEETGKILVFRAGDLKILKSINYSPADLKQFFQEKME